MVSNKLIEFAANKYNFDSNTLNFISDSTNQIYMFKKDNISYILRFQQRPSEYIHQTIAEMNWLYFLANNGMHVSLPLKSIDGQFAILTEDNNIPYIISSFNMASGQPWDRNNPEKWNDTIFFYWGKVMGDIHNVSKNYIPANEIDKRNEFTGRDALMDSIKACPSVNAVGENLINEIMNLPKDNDSYGLIHYDLHPWNFFIEGEQINVFDFDDSLYGWFALDIGIALYHALWWGRSNDVGDYFTERIIKNFLKGYLSANHISDYWLSKIPLFMRFRQICKFSWYFDAEKMEDYQQEIEDIENGVLFTDCELDDTWFVSL